ncbi:MAG: hemolysin III family protein [Bacteroidota bacterium]|jgi:hemolysin III|nr:hemolysin III family protein [Bacteroidota bacterium]NLS99206.1 hemolysin III family protein [Bacteroidales bacterium]OQB78692.1 MAG: hemolysin-III related [Bacteroidetes bacterium ADurb.Bin123]HNZ68036.1 hemolysin III family protein [Prolixibacteraceae bacterium]HOC85986.1 hemolysin III family protein [Prolixibacteraceae bacterium]
MQNPNQASRRSLTLGEEIFNSITHGVGILLSITALVILVVVAATRGDGWHVVSFAIFGTSLILCYTSSTLYHSITNTRIKNIFARFDHAAIFLLIAGTYTPILLTTLRGTVGWVMFGIIWGMAITGIVIRSIYLNRFRKLMVAIYLIMGWMFVFTLKSVILNMPQISLVFLLTGGLSYSIGVIFYAWRRLPFGHGIWHLFVLAGSTLHFFAILYTLL